VLTDEAIDKAVALARESAAVELEVLGAVGVLAGTVAARIRSTRSRASEITSEMICASASAGCFAGAIIIAVSAAGASAAPSTAVDSSLGERVAAAGAVGAAVAATGALVEKGVTSTLARNWGAASDGVPAVEVTAAFEVTAAVEVTAATGGRARACMAPCMERE
jgi:hypothetical protein